MPKVSANDGLATNNPPDPVTDPVGDDPGGFSGDGAPDSTPAGDAGVADVPVTPDLPAADNSPDSYEP